MALHAVFRAILELLPCQSYGSESSVLMTRYSCQKKEKFFFFNFLYLKVIVNSNHVMFEFRSITFLASYFLLAFFQPFNQDRLVNV